VRSKLLIESHSFQLWAVIFEGGEEVITELLSFARQNSIVAAGHLLKGRDRPMLQVILSSPPRHIERRYDEEVGLTIASV
jgi:predicted DNA-binding protein with PD1-like motif